MPEEVDKYKSKVTLKQLTSVFWAFLNNLRKWFSVSAAPGFFVCLFVLYPDKDFLSSEWLWLV